MYSLDCEFYTAEFSTKEELLEDFNENVLDWGLDQDYEILFNGVKTGERTIDLIKKLPSED